MPVADEDLRHVEERLDVVLDGRLAEQPDLGRERRLVPRLAAIALDRLEQRRLLAADIRAGADAQLDVEGEAGAEDVVAEQARRARLREGVLEARVRERVLRAHVDEAALAAGRVRRDRHRLDERERVAFHQHPVLERARLRLVGVAHEVVRLRRLARNRLPLGARRERGAAAAEQVRLRHRAEDTVPAELERAVERGVAAARAIRVERLRIDAGGDPAKQPESRLAGLRQRGAPLRQLDLARLRAGDRPQRGGRALAQPEARARKRSLGHVRAGEPAREVGADVQHVGGALLQRDQRVEAGDPVRIGGRHVEPAAGVAERAFAHPADAPLDGTQRRQQQMAGGRGRHARRDTRSSPARPPRRRSPRALRRSARRWAGGCP